MNGEIEKVEKILESTLVLKGVKGDKFLFRFDIRKIEKSLLFRTSPYFRWLRILRNKFSNIDEMNMRKLLDEVSYAKETAELYRKIFAEVKDWLIGEGKLEPEFLPFRIISFARKQQNSSGKISPEEAFTYALTSRYPLTALFSILGLLKVFNHRRDNSFSIYTRYLKLSDFIKVINKREIYSFEEKIWEKVVRKAVNDIYTLGAKVVENEGVDWELVTKRLADVEKRVENTKPFKEFREFIVLYRSVLERKYDNEIFKQILSDKDQRDKWLEFLRDVFVFMPKNREEQKLLVLTGIILIAEKKNIIYDRGLWITANRIDTLIKNELAMGKTVLKERERLAFKEKKGEGKRKMVV